MKDTLIIRKRKGFGIGKDILLLLVWLTVFVGADVFINWAMNAYSDQLSILYVIFGLTNGSISNVVTIVSVVAGLMFTAVLGAYMAQAGDELTDED